MKASGVVAIGVLGASGMVASPGWGGEARPIFHYQAGPIDYLQRGEVYATWNAHDPARALKPGMKVLFFGRAVGCGENAVDGPVTDEGNPEFAQAAALTGIPMAVPGKGARWSPSAETDQCSQDVRNQSGYSFVHVNEDPGAGGIGIFTFTGPDDRGGRSFFRQYGDAGVAGSGANADIEGTFVAFRFAWQVPGATGPWMGAGADADGRVAEFSSRQGVPAVSVGGADAAPGKPVQAKQQMIVALINPACWKARDTNKGMCQLQYLWNIDVVRTGVDNWNNAAWFKSGGVMLDPGQGGMAVVHGPIGADGESVNDQGLPLYTSKGEPSQHGKFQEKTFRLQVSFGQFKNALRIVAARRLNKTPQRVDAAELGRLIGPQWDDPGQWVLSSVSVAQEVFNPYEDTKAYIGGAVKEISIGRVR